MIKFVLINNLSLFRNYDGTESCFSFFFFFFNLKLNFL